MGRSLTQGARRRLLIDATSALMRSSSH